MTSLRRLTVIVGLMVAWALAGNDRAPLTLTIASEAIAAPSRNQPADDGKAPHDLSALRVLTKVILYVKDNYVDPKRVRPKEMMIAALEAVEKTVPDVLVDGNVDTGKLRVVANGKVKEFDISHVDSLWKMSFTLRDVFDFISRNMRPVEDTRDIEYAAINGMLQTLDPHSVLLKPEMYREMKLTTKGEFGGLGFVIQMKEGNLTVVKVLPKTPAFRAGIKKDDNITKIGEESTVNMDLNEAVSKLRGPVDSRVTITIARKSWEKPQVMTLTRALINIESVQSKMLAQNVGYVRLKNFQGNTTRHLQQALTELDAEARQKGSPNGMRGLVLDLRGNPGGLLDQAIQVSDLFVSDGTIVATVGLSDKLREEKKAHADEGDDAYPIAVLVNAGSASASEIVAGALKNLNRAVIVGRQTFGKGSVQVLYDFPDESALKLTIAKYLTPGDISIQEVGIVPDIELIPTRVTKDRIDLFAPRKTMGEADLDHHFSNPSNATAVKKREDLVLREKPSMSLKYLKESEKEKVAKEAAEKKEDKQKEAALKDAAKDGKGKKPGKNPLTDIDEAPEELDDQLDAESQDEVREDFEVNFARDYVLTAPFTRRDKMLEGGKAFVQDRTKSEEERIAAAIGALGIDWSKGESPKNVQLIGTLKPGADKKIAAGETVQLEVTAENKGSEPIKRLRAWTESENGWLDRREFLFGALKPGEKKSWTVAVKMPKDLISRRDGVTVKFQDDQRVLEDGVTGELSFVEAVRPSFAFNYQVLDNCDGCNGDGLVQRGESMTLLLDVTNVGSGKAQDTFATIKNAGDQNIFIEKGRFKLGELGPGETKTARFNLQVKRGWKGKDFPLRMAVIDEPLEEYTAEKLSIPVASDDAPPVAFEVKKGTVKLGDKTDLLPNADPNAKPIARLPKGGVFNEVARGGQVSVIQWDSDRVAFVRLADVKDAKGAKAAPAKDVAYVAMREPPQISLSVDPQAGGVVTDGDRFTLSAVINSPVLLDAYVLVNDQKVFFRAADPAEEGKMKFTTDFTLKEGNNYVTVFARESQEFLGRKTVLVRRRPVAVAQKMQEASTAKP
ncbi:MAG: PDZ domain-containing protein [Myxococcaceae bacterium]|nr:PDZ domain-containing protein [Myxococcaceae bacterium]